jgi:hypothetical protein
MWSKATFSSDSSRRTSSVLRKEEQRHTFRLGTRHVFSPGSILLGSFTYQDFDSRSQGSHRF